MLLILSYVNINLYFHHLLTFDKFCFYIFKPADSQLETIGAFVMTSSIILHNIHRSFEEVLQETKQFIKYVCC